MTMLDNPAGEVEDPAGGFLGGGPGGGGGAGLGPAGEGGARLAGELAGRAPAGGPGGATGRGVDLSADTTWRVADAALEQMREWQHRPLEPFYPVVYIDALVAKVRDGAAVRNKAVNIAVGIDDGGAKRVLGIWVAPSEGAKAWAQALAQLRNRGLEEVLFVCCDGLSGLGEEITGTWPETTLQTCSPISPPPPRITPPTSPRTR